MVDTIINHTSKEVKADEIEDDDADADIDRFAKQKVDITRIDEFLNVEKK